MTTDGKKLILKYNSMYFKTTQPRSLRMNIVEEMPIVPIHCGQEEEPLHPNVTVRDKTKTKAKPKAKKDTIDQHTWTFLNKSVETHLIQFKQDIQHKLNVLELIRTDSSEEERTKMREFMEYVFEYPKLVLTKPESSTTTSSTTTVAHETRTDAMSNTESVEQPYCIAKRSDGVQCTRKKKKNCEFCGTHAKIEQLHSEKNQSSPSSIHKMEVNAVVIHGIIYYIDVNNNVYHTEDILENKENPRIIAKAVKYGDNSYSIPDLF